VADRKGRCGGVVRPALRPAGSSKTGTVTNSPFLLRGRGLRGPASLNVEVRTCGGARFAHHITSGELPKQIFFSDRDRASTWSCLLTMPPSTAAPLGYCLMSNTSMSSLCPRRRGRWRALLARTRRLCTIPEVVGRESGHFWEARFYSCRWEGVYQWQALAYVERNPCAPAWSAPPNSSPGPVRAPLLRLRPHWLLDSNRGERSTINSAGAGLSTRWTTSLGERLREPRACLPLGGRVHSAMESRPRAACNSGPPDLRAVSAAPAC